MEYETGALRWLPRNLPKPIVQNIMPREKRQKIKDGVTSGLTLAVEPSRRKTWLVDYRRASGARTYHTIGRADLFSVAEAREKAKDFLARVRLGEDVREKKYRLTLKTQKLDNMYSNQQ